MRQPFCVIGLLVALFACGGQTDGTTEVVVSAAASLTDVFSEIERQFEARHPEVDVILNTGGSSMLREQILSGAPVDVFASASPEVMDAIVAAGLISSGPEVFALNELAIAVPLGNPGDVRGLQDFSEDALLIGICAAGVPCGDLARVTLDLADVDPRVDSEEPNVRALLLKLEAGELDAGLVYRTDLLSSAEVQGVDIPEEFIVSASYVIGVLAGSDEEDVAAQLVSFVLSERGRAILSDHGFGLP